MLLLRARHNLRYTGICVKDVALGTKHILALTLKGAKYAGTMFLPSSFVGSAKGYHTYTMTKESGENSHLGLVEGRGRVGVKLDWKISHL